MHPTPDSGPSALLDQIDQRQTLINRYRPFTDKRLLDQLKSYYRIGLVYTSNALEGFTYSESETRILIEEGLTAGGKSLRDALAVTGHAKACDYMFELLHSATIAEENVLFFHKLLEGSLDNESVPGEYRTTAAFVFSKGTGKTFLKPSQIPVAMEDFFSFAANERDKYHPVEFAAILHKKLVSIHPFADGNGRVSRLVMNASLIQKSFLPIIIPPILRAEYIDSLNASDQGNDSGFMNFMFRRQIEGQKEIIRLIEGEDYVLAGTGFPAEKPREKT
ncbi:MAG: Fic family protein [Desulfovibrio sp.]|jgi:Fic family protein|nr:Fic family protein [Desulfovibrio sp.]